MSLPTPRCLGGLLACRGHIYAVGGTEEMLQASKKLTRYDPNSNKWTELPEMIESRFDAGNIKSRNKYLLETYLNIKYTEMLRAAKKLA